jgi:hypothetical protein
MSEVRLIDTNRLIKSIEDNRFTAENVKSLFRITVEAQPTVDAVPREWWNELESTVSKLVEDNDNFPENKQFYDCARFLLNLMGVIERRSDGRV